MSKVATLWGREPAMIMTAIQAIITLAITFGLDLSIEQVGGILTATAALLGLITRSQVSPAGDEEYGH